MSKNKPNLTIQGLIAEAKAFSDLVSHRRYANLYGVTDGKAIGTFIEQKFQSYLSRRYVFAKGNSASGLDLPAVNCDIKVTSIHQPQSSCPYKDSKQKIYGLGYSLLVFVYDKYDDSQTLQSQLRFVSCVYVDATKTADYQTTVGLHRIIEQKGNVDDVFAYLVERNIPGDEVTLFNLAETILADPPQIGYLTISNALQWRLQYRRVVNLCENIDGITKII